VLGGGSEGENEGEDVGDEMEVSLEDEEDGYIVDHTSMRKNKQKDKRMDVDKEFAHGFKFVAFRLLSNYGGSDYGCIYRLRVFGDAVNA